jgi:hypothetical protein
MSEKSGNPPDPVLKGRWRRKAVLIQRSAFQRPPCYSMHIFLITIATVPTTGRPAEQRFQGIINPTAYLQMLKSWRSWTYLLTLSMETFRFNLNARVSRSNMTSYCIYRLQLLRLCKDASCEGTGVEELDCSVREGRGRGETVIGGRGCCHFGGCVAYHNGCSGWCQSRGCCLPSSSESDCVPPDHCRLHQLTCYEPLESDHLLIALESCQRLCTFHHLCRTSATIHHHPILQMIANGAS